MTFGVSLVFLAAAFPRLAHNSSHSRKVRESYANGEISAEECEREQAMEKNRLSNISVVSSSPISDCSNICLCVCMAGAQQYWLGRYLHHQSPTVTFSCNCDKFISHKLRLSAVRQLSTWKTFPPNQAAGITLTRYSLAYGGVRLYSHTRQLYYKYWCIVIYQLPRPGPLLPKGEHYLTIGWKQVAIKHLISTRLIISS